MPFQTELSQAFLDIFKNLPIHLYCEFWGQVVVNSIVWLATISKLLSFIQNDEECANAFFGQAFAEPVNHDLKL